MSPKLAVSGVVRVCYTVVCRCAAVSPYGLRYTRYIVILDGGWDDGSGYYRFQVLSEFVTSSFAVVPLFHPMVSADVPDSDGGGMMVVG
ncbi:hypothetical protein Tco_0959606 [Tanacetum coccineum]